MDTGQPSSKKRPGAVALDAMGYHKGPETLDRDLEGYWKTFQEAPGYDVASYFAFTSIIMIMAAGSKHSNSLPDPDPQWGLPPQDRVPVPWWVVQVLTTGWLRYLKADPGVTLGEAFRLEGGGQGKKRYRDVIEKITRDWKLALDVWDFTQEKRLEGERISIKDRAIPEVAERTGLGEDVVKRAWGTHKEMAKAMHQDWMQNIEK